MDWLTVSERNANKVGNSPSPPQWEQADSGLRLQLKMVTQSEWQDYAMVLWSLPATYAERPEPGRIRTNAKAFQVAKNPVGEYHLYFEFDSVRLLHFFGRNNCCTDIA